MQIAPETPAELRALVTEARRLASFRNHDDAKLLAAMADAIDALLAENVLLREAADLFRANFSPWLIRNAPYLYRSIWGEW
jgi:hypothetical protein